MNITFRIYDKAPEWWDKEVLKYDGLFPSTSKWVSFYQNVGLGKGRYIEVLADRKRVLLVALTEGIIGGGLVLSSPHVFIRLLRSLPYFTTITMHLQPVIVSSQLKRNESMLLDISKKTLNYILKYAEKNHRSITASDYICFSDLNPAIKLRNMNKKKFDLLGTSRLKLISEEENYKLLPSSVRNKISKAQKDGAKITFLDSSDISLYLQGLREGWGSNGLAVNNDKFYTTLATLYPENVKFIVATYKRKVLAGSGLMVFGKAALEFGIYSTTASRELKVPGGDLLKWELIKYGITNNYHFIDFNMIGVTDNGELAEKINNINYYKTKWGGESLYGIKITDLVKPLVAIQQVKYKVLGY